MSETFQLRTVSNTHSTYQTLNSILIEYISDHAISLALIESALVSAGDNPTGILTAVLQ